MTQAAPETKYPDAQLPQIDALEALYFPEGQAAQAAPLELYVPALHSEHDDEFAVELDDPSEHFIHAVPDM